MWRRMIKGNKDSQHREEGEEECLEQVIVTITMKERRNDRVAEAASLSLHQRLNDGCHKGRSIFVSLFSGEESWHSALGFVSNTRLRAIVD